MKSPLGTLLNRAPVSYTSKASRFALPFMSRNDAEAQMRAFGSVGTLFAIVDRLASSVSQVRWGLYRTHDGRGRIAGDQDRREVTSHLALDVMRNPNPFQTWPEFIEAGQQYYELTGEEYWLIGSMKRMGKVPTELWTVRPDKILPVPDPDDFLSGYVYQGPDGERVPLELDQVISIRRPNPLDSYRGIGPVQSLLADLDSARYSAEWNRNFFRNNASPGGIIEVPDRLEDDEFRELVTRWNEQHRGVQNAHRVAILEHGKWVDRAYSQRDMQFAELRQVSRDVIMEAFGFPRPLLGVTDDVNRANAEAGEYVFARWLLVERLERIKHALNHRFLPMFGETATGVEFDYCDPVNENGEAANAERDSKVQAAVALISAGADPKETLAAFGLPDIPFKEKTEEVSA